MSASEPRCLYLIRHARAAERGDRWLVDAERPLTDAGEARMRLGVRGMAALGVGVAVVVTSPLVRAVATAEIVVRGLTPHPKLVTSAALAPDGTPDEIAATLADHGQARGVAVVGHEPGLGELAAWLTGAHRPLPFKKGAVCRIDVFEWPPAARAGTLVWFATPRMLRAMG